MTKDKTKKILKLLLRVFVTCLLLWVVFSRINLQQIGQTTKGTRWEFLIIIWALAVLVFWIRTVRMRLILKRQDCAVGTIKIFGASAVTSLYSLIMPGLLSTGVKWYILKHHTGKGSNVLSSMMYNQATDIVVRVLLGLVAIIITNPGGCQQVPAVCGIITAGIILICVLLLNRRTGAKISAVFAYALKPLPKTIRAPAEKILEQIKVFQTAGWAFHLKMAGINLVSALLSVVIYVYAAKAAGIAVPVAVLVWQSSAVYVLGRLPISVANLGVREVTLVGTLSLYGVEAPAALLMSMILFSITVLMAIMGAFFQLCWIVPRPEKDKQD